MSYPHVMLTLQTVSPMSTLTHAHLNQRKKSPPRRGFRFRRHHNWNKLARNVRVRRGVGHMIHPLLVGSPALNVPEVPRPGRSALRHHFEMLQYRPDANGDEAEAGDEPERKDGKVV